MSVCAGLEAALTVGICCTFQDLGSIVHNPRKLRATLLSLSARLKMLKKLEELEHAL
jgi:hypothetical protein